MKPKLHRGRKRVLQNRQDAALSSHLQHRQPVVLPGDRRSPSTQHRGLRPLSIARHGTAVMLYLRRTDLPPCCASCHSRPQQVSRAESTFFGDVLRHNSWTLCFIPVTGS